MGQCDGYAGIENEDEGLKSYFNNYLKIIQINRTRDCLEGRSKLWIWTWYFAIINRGSCQHERPKDRTNTTSNNTEDLNDLKIDTVISQVSDAIWTEVDILFPNDIMATGKVIDSVLLDTDELLWTKRVACVLQAPLN